ncbi:33K [Aviadenovirus cerasi]|uniref:33K n=1 Tax=Fowl aviadenovirus 5 TaxID=172861 RepID=A0A6M3Z579_9ADEN|nr:33K [Fowl aviadenovirus 5]
MAQRMLDEKTRVTEEPPSDETAVPFPTDLRASYGVAEDTGRSIESDGETLGSQDTEEEDPLSTISEEEEEETEEAEKENVPPSRGHLERRRSASSLEKTLPRPPAKKEIPQKLVVFSFFVTVDADRRRFHRHGAAKGEPPKEAPAASETPEPVPQPVADLKAEILDMLLEIETFARKNPTRRVSIRNRTRESITRQLHYVKNEEKLTKLKTDAEKILHLWRSLS